MKIQITISLERRLDDDYKYKPYCIFSCIASQPFVHQNTRPAGQNLIFDCVVHRKPCLAGERVTCTNGSKQLYSQSVCLITQSEK